MTTIISLGGSIVAPLGPDADYVRAFAELVEARLEAKADERFVLIVGGGGPARQWQDACKKVRPESSHDSLDWIGIMATRLNAELMRAVFPTRCSDSVVTDPSGSIVFENRILVAAGWKPGFSTDFDAVILAERFGARRVINLSNIAQVYTDDPKLNPAARPLPEIRWSDFRALVGSVWIPGKNTPFDPIASKKAEELGLEVICADGRNLPNLAKILDSEEYFGTRIH